MTVPGEAGLHLRPDQALPQQQKAEDIALRSAMRFQDALALIGVDIVSVTPLVSRRGSSGVRLGVCEASDVDKVSEAVEQVASERAKAALLAKTIMEFAEGGAR
jgi:hypothetical protein